MIGDFMSNMMNWLFELGWFSKLLLVTTLLCFWLLWLQHKLNKQGESNYRNSFKRNFP